MKNVEDKWALYTAVAAVLVSVVIAVGSSITTVWTTSRQLNAARAQLEQSSQTVEKQIAAQKESVTAQLTEQADESESSLDHDRDENRKSIMTEAWSSLLGLYAREADSLREQWISLGAANRSAGPARTLLLASWRTTYDALSDLRTEISVASFNAGLVGSPSAYSCIRSLDLIFKWYEVDVLRYANYASTQPSDLELQPIADLGTKYNSLIEDGLRATLDFARVDVIVLAGEDQYDIQECEVPNANDVQPETYE